MPRLLEAEADPTITTMASYAFIDRLSHLFLLSLQEGLSCLHLAAMHDSKESAKIAKALLTTDLDPTLKESKVSIVKHCVNH